MFHYLECLPKALGGAGVGVWLKPMRHKGLYLRVVKVGHANIGKTPEGLFVSRNTTRHDETVFVVLVHLVLYLLYHRVSILARHFVQAVQQRQQFALRQGLSHKALWLRKPTNIELSHQLLQQVGVVIPRF